MAVRPLLLGVLVLTAGLAGCAETQPSDANTSPSTGGDGPELSLEPVAPAGTDLTLETGGKQTFVVECKVSGLSELVGVTWEHAIRGEEIVDGDRQYLSSDEQSAFTATFDPAGEHLVTARCTTESARTPVHAWNVTVEDPEPDPGSANETNGTSNSTSGNESTSSNSTGDGSTSSGTNDTTTASPQANLTIHVVDVGQADGIVLHFPNTTAVIDTGRWNGEGETAVRDHLSAESADPDQLVVTHPDADHSGGCDEVLNAFQIEQIYRPGIGSDTQTWQDCRQAIDAEDANVHTDNSLDPGDQLDWTSTATVEVLHVDSSRTSEPNEGSIVLEVNYGSFDAVFPADISCDTEDAILQRGLLGDVELLKVAHHGSAGSTCDPWLDQTQPEVGVISVGENSYGHPTQEALDRLAAHGTTVYRTDHNGTVTVETNGTGWDVRTQTTGGTSGSTSDSDTSSGSTSTSSSAVQIGEIQADAPGDEYDNLNGEWVQIVNEGNESVRMGGWTLSDEADHVYTFPSGFALDPGTGVKVHTGSGEDNATDLYWGSGSPVWNNGGDTATLEDGTASQVDQKVY